MEERWERGREVMHESLEFARVGQEDQALKVLDDAIAEARFTKIAIYGFQFCAATPQFFLATLETVGAKYTTEKWRFHWRKTIVSLLTTSHSYC
jgi:hypothetical protein